MADDPFPDDGGTLVPASIGDREWTFTFFEEIDLDTGQKRAPLAQYSVQVYDQNGSVLEVKNGKLFEQGGVDHLRPADKSQLVSMDAALKVKAENAWVNFFLDHLQGLV